MGGGGGKVLLQREGETDLAGDVMGIEVEAADMLVDAGEGVKALDGALSSLHHLALHRLGAPWNVLNPACLHHQACVNHEAACQRGQKGYHNNGIMHVLQWLYKACQHSGHAKETVRQVCVSYTRH